MNRLYLFGIIILILIFFLGGNKNSLRLENSGGKADSLFQSNEISQLLRETDLSTGAFKSAYLGFIQLKKENSITNDSLITIIDYGKPSNEERFFIIDIKKMVLVKKSLVAHGQNSGEIMAESFSNTMHSHKSSLGLFITADTYMGRQGYSLRLKGIDKGLNDNALERAIVIHGAKYVSESYILQNGRIGRSYGCPALPDNIAPEVIDLIKGGSCLYIYHPAIDVNSLQMAQITSE